MAGHLLLAPADEWLRVNKRLRSNPRWGVNFCNLLEKEAEMNLLPQKREALRRCFEQPPLCL